MPTIRRQIKGTISQINSATGEIKKESLNAIADFMDGFGIELQPLAGFAKFMNAMLLTVGKHLVAQLIIKIPFFGKLADNEGSIDWEWLEEWQHTGFPFRVIVNPMVDAIPPGKVYLHGGDWDGYLMEPKDPDQDQLRVLRSDGTNRVQIYLRDPHDARTFVYQHGA